MEEGPEENKAHLHDQRVMGMNADCVEFCNCSGYEDLVAVGTYELKEEEQKRVGELHLFELLFDDEGRILLKEAGSVSQIHTRFPRR